MNVLLVTIGSAGDVHPFVALGRALQSRGHRATLITSGYFEDLIRGEGLGFIDLIDAGHFDAFLQNPDFWVPPKGIRLLIDEIILPLMLRTYGIIDALDRSNTVMAASTMALGARVAQEKLGIPLATVHLQPYSFLSFEDPPVSPVINFPTWLPRSVTRGIWNTMDMISDRTLGTGIKHFRADLGLPRAIHLFTRWVHSPRMVLGLFPGWYGRPASDWPAQTELTGFIRFDRDRGEPLPREMLAYLEAGPPPVVFTPGSAMKHADGFFSAAVEACRSMDRRGILITPHREHLPSNLPDGIAHFDYAPFSLLLPRSAALVHHGGIGTVAQGLAAGIPQLVMPMNFDQPDNAARLHRLGVGVSLLPRKFTGPAVAHALDALLTSQRVLARCREVSAEIDFDQGLERACRRIEELGTDLVV